MPRTLLVSFSLLALVVTARPIVPVPYVLGCNVFFFFSIALIPVLCSDYPQPVEVQDAIKAIFEECTKLVQTSIVLCASHELFFFQAIRP